MTITDRYRKGSLATATVVGGVITGIAVTSGGTDYRAPIVEITDTIGTGATAIAVLDKNNLTVGTGMRKFLSTDPLPILPLAVADTVTYPGCDYYKISIEESIRCLCIQTSPRPHTGVIGRPIQRRRHPG